jgi:hypothetical protein
MVQPSPLKSVGKKRKQPDDGQSSGRSKRAIIAEDKSSPATKGSKVVLSPMKQSSVNKWLGLGEEPKFTLGKTLSSTNAQPYKRKRVQVKTPLDNQTSKRAKKVLKERVPQLVLPKLPMTAKQIKRYFESLATSPKKDDKTSEVPALASTIRPSPYKRKHKLKRDFPPSPAGNVRKMKGPRALIPKRLKRTDFLQPFTWKSMGLQTPEKTKKGQTPPMGRRRKQPSPYSLPPKWLSPSGGYPPVARSPTLKEMPSLSATKVKKGSRRDPAPYSPAQTRARRKLTFENQALERPKSKPSPSKRDWKLKMKQPVKDVEKRKKETP